jgi:hypothetical protein
MTPLQVAAAVALHGRRPDIPEGHGPPRLHKLITSCFSADPKLRPSASECVKLLTLMLRTQEVASNDASRGTDFTNPSSRMPIRKLSAVTTFANLSSIPPHARPVDFTLVSSNLTHLTPGNARGLAPGSASHPAPKQPPPGVGGEARGLGQEDASHHALSTASSLYLTIESEAEEGLAEEP